MTHRTWKAWSPEEEATLLARYDGTVQSAQLLAEEFGRTVGAVRHHCYALGLSISSRRWTDEELRLLEAEYPNPDIEVADIANRLGRTCGAVTVKAHLMGLGRRKDWSPEEDDVALASERRWGGAIEAAQQINRTAAAIRQRRTQLRQVRAAG